MRETAVLGWGRALPARSVSNEEIADALGTTAAEILANTGVHTRYYVDEGAGTGPSDLGVVAARKALDAAGRTPNDVDLIVFASVTPDIAFPGPGCFLQDKLECRTVGALDIRAQCASAVYGLVTADRFIRAGKAERVLVVGGEVHSTSLEYAPRGRDVTPRFGDGAGAMLIGGGMAEAGVLATVIHNDPAGFRRFWCEYPASRHYPSRMERGPFDEGRHFPALDAAALEGDAEARLVSGAHEALAAAGLSIDAVRLVVSHYVDPRVATRAAERLGAPPERIVAPAEQHGHVSSGGPIMAVAAAIERGAVGSGDVVLITTMGAGIAWGAAVVRV